MFENLLRETPVYELAKEKKSAIIAEWAFNCGYDFFSSKEYAFTFKEYKNALLKNSSGIYKIMYIMSFHGFYHPMRLLFELLFRFKQVFKKTHIL